MQEQTNQQEQEASSSGQPIGSEAQLAVAGDEQGTTPGQQLVQQGQHVAQQAQEQAGALADQARWQIATQLTRQKEHATASLDALAQAIREAGRQMQERGQSSADGYADTAATQVERISSYLSERDITALRQEAERFARSRTPLFLAGAFTVGWLGARFFKSSTPADGAAQRDYTPSMNLPAPALQSDTR